MKRKRKDDKKRLDLFDAMTDKAWFHAVDALWGIGKIKFHLGAYADGRTSTQVHAFVPADECYVVMTDILLRGALHPSMRSATNEGGVLEVYERLGGGESSDYETGWMSRRLTIEHTSMRKPWKIRVAIGPGTLDDDKGLIVPVKGASVEEVRFFLSMTDARSMAARLCAAIDGYWAMLARMRVKEYVRQQKLRASKAPRH